MIVFSHIAIFCSDLDKMEKFYQDVFSMKTLWKNKDDKAYLTTGNQDNFGLLRKEGYVNKNPYDLKRIMDDPNLTPNFPHFGVVVDSEKEFEQLMIKIKEMGIDIVGPKVSKDKTKSFYFLDPEYNPVHVVIQ